MLRCFIFLWFCLFPSSFSGDTTNQFTLIVKDKMYLCTPVHNGKIMISIEAHAPRIVQFRHTIVARSAFHRVIIQRWFFKNWFFILVLCLYDSIPLSKQTQCHIYWIIFACIYCYSNCYYLLVTILLFSIQTIDNNIIQFNRDLPIFMSLLKNSKIVHELILLNTS